jgi:hypothetical protein
MFIKFSQDKTNYQKGQIFPFLIMILVVVIILVMITVNLGKIALFKTDVSNAADAGALAAASVLSGTLLGFGLTSDMMCGEMIVTIIFVIILCICQNYGAAIATFIAWWIGAMSTYIKSLGDGRMAWSNAKKTALQYAFNNVGVDEPRPTFEQFLLGAYGVSDPTSLAPGVISTRYDEYLKCESTACRSYGRSGFTKFMDNWRRGFAAPIGDIRPGRTSAARIISGYGWTQRDDTTFRNSFEHGSSYKNYDNWVEVEVLGTSIYPLGVMDPVAAPQSVYYAIVDALLGWLPWWLEWISDIVKWILDIITFITDVVHPGSLTFGNPPAEENNTDKNQIMVYVRRYKKPDDLGLWSFRYGISSAMASSRTFREDESKTIETVCINPRRFLESLARSWDFDWFETEDHLFETELTQAY